MFVHRNGELETEGNVPVIQEYTLKHDNAGYTFDNGPYFVMERCGKFCFMVSNFVGGMFCSFSDIFRNIFV